MYTIEHNCRGRDLHVSDKVLDAKGEDVAGYAARILARREYGRRGEVCHVNLSGWAEDGSFQEYEAFIGAPSSDGCGGLAGHNVWMSITKE